MCMSGLTFGCYLTNKCRSVSKPDCSLGMHEWQPDRYSRLDLQAAEFSRRTDLKKKSAWMVSLSLSLSLSLSV